MAQKPAWLALAESDVGLSEVTGSKDNPLILKMFADCGHPEVDHDETAWCAARVGSCLVRAGLPTPPKAVNLMARSYLNYGTPCEPKPGAIAVWARGRPPSGHVNIVVDVLGDGTIRCIDGNSGNRVAYTTRNAKDALAFRWPVSATKKDLKAAGSTEIAAAGAMKQVVVATLGTAGSGAAITAAQAPPAATVLPDIGSLPDLSQASDQVSHVNTLLEGVSALGKLVFASPWLAPAVLLCGVVWYLAVRVERQRIAKAAAGVALSGEV